MRRSNTKRHLVQSDFALIGVSEVSVARRTRYTIVVPCYPHGQLPMVMLGYRVLTSWLTIHTRIRRSGLAASA
jgi:hypothetical protein